MPCAVLVHGIARRGQQASELGGSEEALSEAEGQCLSPVVQRCCTQGSNSVLVGGVGITQYDAVAPLLQPLKAVLLLHRQARVPYRGRVLKPCPDVPLVQGEHRGHGEAKLPGPIENENHSICPFYDVIHMGLPTEGIFNINTQQLHFMCDGQRDVVELEIGKRNRAFQLSRTGVKGLTFDWISYHIKQFALT